MVEIKGDGDLLIAAHTGEDFKVYDGWIGDGNISLVIPPMVERVVDTRWLGIPAFLRDVQHGKITLRRSAIVPDARAPDVAPQFALSDTQRDLARRVCYAQDISESLKTAFEVHHLLGPGGMTPNGVRVTKTYVRNEHRLLLAAALDLEARCKKRAKVVRWLKRLLQEVEAI